MMLPASVTRLATYEDVAGRQVAASYTDPVSEYNALRHSAVLVDRSYRQRLAVIGKSAAETLTGLVTNDVKALHAGRGQYAAVLTNKGKVVADLRIFCTDENTFLVDSSPRAAPGWMAVVRKYVNPRLAAYKDTTDTVADIGVFGPDAARVVAGVLGADATGLAALDAYSCPRFEYNGNQIILGVSPELHLPGYDLFCDTAAAEQLSQALIAQGAVPAGQTAWETARIEAGHPEWGLDMDENTLVQEANLDQLHAVSYTKGCYIGQETVARVHFRGHVNRHLRGLRFVTPALPPRLAEVLGEGDKNVGEVRSSVQSPRLGGIAIAMIRREVPIRSSVTIRWDGGSCQAGVCELPFEQNPT